MDFASPSSLIAEQGASGLKFRICLNLRASFDVCREEFCFASRKIGKAPEIPGRFPVLGQRALEKDFLFHTTFNAIVINIKPGSNKFFLCELLDVWGFSASGWTPMHWHLRVLEPKNTKCTPDHFGDFIADESGDRVYEFLYANGTVKKGKLAGDWNAPKRSTTNGALLWPETLDYFLKCINP